MRREQVFFPILRTVAKHDWALRIANRLLEPFNPFDPQRGVDPYPLYEKLRAEGGPVYHHPRLRLWLVTGYEECEQLLRATDVSVSRADLMAVIWPYRKLDPATLDLIRNSLLMVDPPDHTRLRKLVNRAFTPRAIAALEPRIAEITDELIAELRTGETVDAMATFADRLPIFAISDMLGLPRGEWDRFKAISDEVVKFVDPINGFDPGVMDETVSEFRGIVDGLIAERGRQPRDDLLSGLLEVEEEGDKLTHDELMGMVALLLVAGHETTSGLIGNGLAAFHRDRIARKQLLAEPDLAANAVEELLRYDSPVQATDRVATADVVVGDQVIPAGAAAVTMLGAANRDPRRYDHPDQLVLDRTDPHPLSFGHGIHHCLGAALARLEATIAVPAFLDAFPDYAVVDSDVIWKRSVTIRGPRALPVRL